MVLLAFTHLVRLVGALTTLCLVPHGKQSLLICLFHFLKSSLSKAYLEIHSLALANYFPKTCRLASVPKSGVSGYGSF